MAINPGRALAVALPELAQTCTERDTMPYALGIGIGHDTTDLSFLHESGPKALPTVAVVLSKDLRDADTGALIATTWRMACTRADGGVGRGHGQTPAPLPPMPDHPPDMARALPAGSQAALICRLSGEAGTPGKGGAGR